MESTRPEYPGALTLNLDIPMEAEVAETFRILLNSDGPVAFGPGSEYQLPKIVSEKFSIKSFIGTAIYPRNSKPWELGIHQCSCARVWTQNEMQLFKVIGHRIADSLSLLLNYQELIESRKLLYSIVENIPDMIFVKDAEDLRFVRFNKAGEQLLGYPRQEMVGKNDYDFFPKEVADFFTSKDHEVLAQKKPVDIPEEIIKTRFKGERILHTQKFPIMSETGNPIYLLGISRDITEQKQAEARERMKPEILEILNQHHGDLSRINEILLTIKKHTGLEAAAIRLKEGEDFPYYTTSGFPEDFIITERELCARDENGRIVRDEMGAPVLECMCGNILCGRVNPDMPFFTEGGSFWTNSTSKLLASSTEADRQSRTRNRCNGEGYESVALIPLRSGDEILGLLQLNDSRPNRFTLEMIRFFENMGLSIGIAFSRKGAEDALRKSERSLKEAQHMSKTGNWELDLINNKLFWSDEIYQIFEIDQKLFGASYEAFLDAIHPDDREAVNRAYTDSLKFKTPYEIIHRLRMNDGRVKHVLEKCETFFGEDETPIRSLGTVQDITESRKSEEERDRLSSAIEQAAETIVITDAEGTIQYVNPSFVKETGYSRNEAIGKNPRFLKSGEQCEGFYRNLWETISSGKTWEGRFVNKKKNGELYTEEASISPVMDSSGKIVNYVAVKRDITEQLQMLAEKEKLKAMLLQSQKMEAIGQLAGGMAHDFNNMLGVILGATELAKYDVDESSPMQDEFRTIIAAVKNAKELTMKLLTFSRRDKLEGQSVDVRKLINDVLGMLSRTVPKRITLEAVVRDDSVIHCNQNQIQHALVNVCNNAVDAMPEGGKLTIDAGAVNLPDGLCISCGQKLGGKFCLIQVSDTGSGMTKDVLSKIMEPFFTTKELGKGTGLGLSVSQGIIISHNGHLHIYSEPGIGTCVKIYLPIDNASVSQRDSILEKKLFEGTETILVIDDESILLQQVGRMINKNGYKTLLADKGNAAIELYRKHRDEIAVVVLDLMMPGMDGVEVEGRLKELNPDVKIVLSSGFSADGVATKLLKNKYRRFVQKPVEMSALCIAIRELIDGKE